MLKQKIHQIFEWVQIRWEGLRGLFQALTLIRFNILLGVICSLALYTGQGQDVLRALVEVEKWHHNLVPKICFLAFTITFALTAWYFARVMFAFTFPTETEGQAFYAHVSYKNIKQRVTRWLGPGILFMVSGALIKAGQSYETMNELSSRQLFIMAAVLALMGGVMLFVVYKCRERFKLDALGMGEQQKYKSYRDLPRAPRVWFLAAHLASVLAFTLFSYQAGVIAPWIGTAGILMLWATTLVAIGGGLVYIGNQYRIPVIGFIIILVMGFSLFNDNHRVRQTKDMRPYHEQEAWAKMTQAIRTVLSKFASNMIYTRGISPSDDPRTDPFETYFLAWFRDLEPRWREGRHGQHGYDGPIPIILVSTEGGGIRAAYWTANVLSELQDRSKELVKTGKIPLDFARHVFSISGVSGGSLGGAVFASMIKEQHAKQTDVSKASCNLQAGKRLRLAAKTILSEDFLSPTVGVLLFPDMFQRFLPVGILDDRALALEEAWERAWFNCAGSERFAMPFDDLWSDDHFQVPLLFLNSTVVETGQRIIMHPLPFATAKSPQPNDLPSTTFQDHFNNALDGPAVLGGEVPLSTAVHMSARFTYVSPAGTIFRQDLPKDSSARSQAEPQVIRVVDGGYFENSGAVTTDEILLAIRKISEDHELNIRPIVIHISNDPLKQQSRKEEDFAGSRAFMPEVLSPVWALLNVRPARGYQARDELSNRTEPHRHHSNTGQAMEGSFVHFQLCEYKRRLPLGWMLSELTREDMDNQLPREHIAPDNMFKPIAQFNLNNLHVVLNGLAGNYHASGNQTEFLDHYDRDCRGEKSSTT